MPAPANDLLANAAVLTMGTVTGTTVGASASTDEINEWFDGNVPSVWYVYTNSTGDVVTFTITRPVATSGFAGSDVYVDGWLYDGTTTDFPTLIGGTYAGDLWNPQRSVFYLRDGQSIYLLVSNLDYDPTFTGTFSFDVSIVDGLAGRVLIAFDDGPLVADPAWTNLDVTDNLVADIEITAGRQGEFDETETNHATVRLNDTTGLFDPDNYLSPYHGKLYGKQILLQLQNPVDGSWEQRFRGVIRRWDHDLNESTRNGSSILSNVTIEAVGVFDYLARMELIAGVHGDPPPTGREDTVFYEDGEVDDRIIALLTDAGLDSSRYVVFSGNVMVQESLYDNGDPVLTALRDAADAETPSALANIYEDRRGRFVFHGRQAKLDPATVSGAAGPTAWDYQVFKIGDGAAISGRDSVPADPDYAQIRPPFTFRVDLADLINTALVIPRGIDRAVVPSLVEKDDTSIANYGPSPFTYQDSINAGHKTNSDTDAEDCNRSAQFLVDNYKDPLVRIEDLTVKAIAPDDPRADATWNVLTKADISDTVHIRVYYPGVDNPPLDGDYFIEGWAQTITPLNTDHDMVEISLNLSPAPTLNPYSD